MELSKQVVSLELAKQLKELGVPQDSLFYWWISNKGEHKNHINFQPAVHYERPIPMKDKNWDWSIVSAFTVAELGEMLPWTVQGGELYIEKFVHAEGGDRWGVSYKSIRDKHDVIVATDKTKLPCYTLPNALAKMLIWLIENKYYLGGD